jgi:benzodiazapine receptor
MNRDTVRQYVNLLVAIATIIFNILAVALPLNGQDTGAISDSFKVLFVPAGYVFSIWGLIYIGWMAFAIYQVRPSQRENPRLRRIGYLFALSGLANMAWLYCWHYGYYALSVVVMLVLLLSLIAIYLRLQIGQVQVSTAERWCVDITFSVYLGWITVATIANVTDLLYYLQWDGWGISPEMWTFIMLVAAVLITAAVCLTRGDVAFALVVIWALVGIAIKQAAVPAVAAAAWVAAAAVAVALVAGVILARRRAPLPAAAG